MNNLHRPTADRRPVGAFCVTPLGTHATTLVPATHLAITGPTAGAIGDAHPAYTAGAALAPRVWGSGATATVVPTEAVARASTTTQDLEIRVRAIFALDAQEASPHTLAHVRAVVQAMVDAANRDLDGTHLKLVTFPRHDVEIRVDVPGKELRRDCLLDQATIQEMEAGEIGEIEGAALIDKASVKAAQRRNEAAAERPNTLLWLFTRGNRFEAVIDGGHSLQSYNRPDRYIRHADWLAGISPVNPTEEVDRQDASWTIVPGLADPAGVSFESRNFPGHFLRHQDFRLRLGVNDGSALFKRDATFRVHRGLADSSCQSYESVNLPNHWIRHRNNELWLDRQDGTTLFEQDATFRVVDPWRACFRKWRSVDERGGSFSDLNIQFVALSDQFLHSVEFGRNDASRAVHETGHYLGLGHTHREPFHDLGATVPPASQNGTAVQRLDAWKAVVSTWLGSQPHGGSPAKALAIYDPDGLTQTPCDPGAGIMALANQAAGHKFDALGPVASIALTVPGITAPVVMAPLRDNPMGYYLDHTPDAMRFTADQVAVMRGHLTMPKGRRRPLVAAQLGDTATPSLRVCAVWSPGTAAQRMVWGWHLDELQAENRRMRQAGMVMTHQQGYSLGDQIVFDAVWGPGSVAQDIVWGWLEEHIRSELPRQAALGLRPRQVQGYLHLDHGIRYNVVYEQSARPCEVLLGVTADALSHAFQSRYGSGYRMSCLRAHAQPDGGVRYSAVLSQISQPGEQVLHVGRTLDEIAAIYGQEWHAGRRIRHVTTVKTAAGHRWSAVFEPDTRNQFVQWLHVRERITERYDERWAMDYRLQALNVTPA